MSSPVRGTKRKSVSARGKGPGTRKMVGGAPAADVITPADNKEGDKNTTSVVVSSVEDVKEEPCQGITWGRLLNRHLAKTVAETKTFSGRPLIGSV